MLVKVRMKIGERIRKKIKGFFFLTKKERAFHKSEFGGFSAKYNQSFILQKTSKLKLRFVNEK